MGYARVSTQDQSTALQLDALTKAGCARIFSESASGAQRDRLELARALDYMRAGDTLVVWKLDRLARSLKQLVETVEDLKARGMASDPSPSPSTRPVVASSPSTFSRRWPSSSAP